MLDFAEILSTLSTLSLNVFDLQFPKGSDKPKPIWNGPQAPATFNFQIAEIEHGFFLHPPLL